MTNVIAELAAIDPESYRCGERSRCVECFIGSDACHLVYAATSAKKWAESPGADPLVWMIARAVQHGRDIVPVASMMESAVQRDRESR